jgi:hypothetical protein
LGAGEYGHYLTEVDVGKAVFYGDEYVYNAIVRLANERNKMLSYRHYVTDALHAIVNNTAGAQRVVLKSTFRDMWEGSPEESEASMSPDEIILRMKEEFRKKGGME